MFFINIVYLNKKVLILILDGKISLAIHYIEDYDLLCKKVYNLLNDNGYFIFSHGHPMDSAVILKGIDDNFVIINDKKIVKTKTKEYEKNSIITNCTPTSDSECRRCKETSHDC